MRRSSSVRGSLDAVPTELLLEIIPSIPFHPQTIQNLHLTCRRFNNVLSYHEKGLVADITNSQSCAMILRMFPNFTITTFKSLGALHKRLDDLDSLHVQWLHVTNNSPELGWLSGRWEGIHKAGLLLLYRLQDVKSDTLKTELLQSLPSTSLACLVFKLVSSIRILRIYGSGPVHGTFAAGDVMARSDIELAFEELLLEHGPSFFTALLKSGASEGDRHEWAVKTLEAEIAGMIERQSPTPDGIPKPTTLVSRLRRAFAASLACDMSENTNKMWEVLSSTSFDDMSQSKLLQIVTGEAVAGGMKRMGF